MPIQDGEDRQSHGENPFVTRVAAPAQARPLRDILCVLLLAGLMTVFFLKPHNLATAPVHEQTYGEMLAGRPYWTYDTPPRTIPDLGFVDENGAARHLSDFRGRYVLVDVWEAGCYASPQVVPGLDVLARNSDERRLAIVNLEDQSGPAAVRDFYKTHGIRNLKVYTDGQASARADLQLRGEPALFLLNPEGKEVFRLEGTMDFTDPVNRAWLRSQMK